MEELTQAAGRYLVAHNRKFHSASTSCLISAPSGAVNHDDIQSHEEVQKAAIQCFLCKRFGHRASECKSTIKTQCYYICGKLGHEAKRCWLVRRGTNGNTKTTYKAAAGEDKSKDEHSLQRGGRTRDSRDVSAGCLWSPTVCQSQRNTSYHKTVRLPALEPRGKQRVSINTPIVRTAVSESMPIAKGWVGDARIASLRDTGCSGVIVKQQFVKHDQYTGHDGFIQLVDNSIKKVPIARVNVDTLICQAQWKRYVFTCHL